MWLTRLRFSPDVLNSNLEETNKCFRWIGEPDMSIGFTGFHFLPYGIFLFPGIKSICTIPDYHDCTKINPERSIKQSNPIKSHTNPTNTNSISQSQVYKKKYKITSQECFYTYLALTS